ncbi:MAG: hypothetical protein PHT79_09335 [Syntrophomonadaceae bacterium]|nr:hypothetical protein [Syntrophomonadaceae bacterium]MDD4549944.1 hypothetical protein [Syntrophomonadaceae bacterium]
MFKTTYALLDLLETVDTVKGRKKLQKTVHMLQIRKNPFNFDYQYHFYGPYSSELQIEVNSLVKEGFVIETKMDETYVYQITEKGKTFKKNLESQFKESVNVEHELSQLLNRQSTSLLEMASTYAYLLDNGYEPSEAKNKCKELKPHLIKEMDSAIKFYNEHIAN